MNKISEIIAAVMAALGRLVSKSVSVLKMVGGRMVRSTEVVLERVFDGAAATPKLAVDLMGATSKLAIGAVSDAVKLPFRLAGLAFGGRRQPEQAPQDAAAEAAQAAQAQVAKSDAADDARQVLFALRKVASARAAGQTPDPAHAGRLPQRLLDYVGGLSPEECGALARRPTSELRDIAAFRSQKPKAAGDGQEAEADRQRSADDEPTAEPVVSLDAQRDARRARLRAALRGMTSDQARHQVADEAYAMAARR